MKKYKSLEKNQGFFLMQEMGLEQNSKPENPHRKEFSGVLTWVCKQSVKQVRTSLYFYPIFYYTIENRTFVWYNIYME